MNPDSTNTNLSELLKARFPGISAEMAEKAEAFHRILAEENRLQNLTRLIKPEDFIRGHFLDVWTLLQLGWVQYPAMDFGSGSGVPGLLMAALDGGEWFLVESELRKAEFLARAAERLDLKKVTAVHARGEEWLKGHSVGSIVMRAVGPMERLARWVLPCSTWNSLILFKGPKWDSEWESFSKSPLQKKRGRVAVRQIHTYQVAVDEPIERKIVQIQRAEG